MTKVRAKRLAGNGLFLLRKICYLSKSPFPLRALLKAQYLWSDDGNNDVDVPLINKNWIKTYQQQRYCLHGLNMLKLCVGPGYFALYLKWADPGLFCLFSSCSHYNSNNTNWKNCRWSAWESNPWPHNLGADNTKELWGPPYACPILESLYDGGLHAVGRSESPWSLVTTKNATRVIVVGLNDINPSVLPGFKSGRKTAEIELKMFQCWSHACNPLGNYHGSFSSQYLAFEI